MFFKKPKTDKSSMSKKPTTIEGAKSLDDIIAELDNGPSSIDSFRVQNALPSGAQNALPFDIATGVETGVGTQPQPQIGSVTQSRPQAVGMHKAEDILADMPVWNPSLISMDLADAPASAATTSSENSFQFDDFENLDFTQRFNKVRQNIKDRRTEAQTVEAHRSELDLRSSDSSINSVESTSFFNHSNSNGDTSANPQFSQVHNQDFGFDESVAQVTQNSDTVPKSVGKFVLNDENIGTGTCIKRQYPDPKFKETLPRGISRDDQVIHTIYGDRALPVCSICGNREKIGMWTRDGFPVYEAWEMDKSLYSSEGVQVAVMCDECAQQHFEEVIDLSSRMQIKPMVGLADLNLLAKLLMMMYGSDFDDLKLDPAVLNDLSKSKAALEDFNSYFDKDIPEVIRRVALLFSVDSVGFIATCDNAPIGFISAKFTQPVKTDLRYIGQVYAMWVCSTFRDLGVGHALVESLYAFTLNTAPVYHLTVNTNFVGMRNVESYLIDRYFEKTAAPSQFLFKELNLES